MLKDNIIFIGISIDWKLRNFKDIGVVFWIESIVIEFI